MGFMDSIIGGSSSSSKSVQGYGALPRSAQIALDDLAIGSRFLLSPMTYNKKTKSLDTNQANIDRFKPLAKTGDEITAFDRLRDGFAPTAETLRSDIDMQMNPYDSYMTDEINREAQGANSILQQNMSNAGQLGSNAQMFGASDIEMNRLRTIGQFKQDQYNSAIDRALGRITDLRALDTANLLDIGGFERDLDWQTKQAPVNALNAASGVLNQGGFSSAMGSTGTSTSKSSSSGGLLNALGGAKGVGSVIAGIGALSDPRLKENVIREGVENGHQLYSFSYKGDSKRYLGVMADEILQTHPEAVEEVHGYLAVNYDAIGVKFREAPHGA